MRYPAFDLTGRSALVTGGSKGLGLAMAKALAAAGADVMICARKPHELEAAALAIDAMGPGKTLVESADLFQRAEATRLARAAEVRLGKVDILINNAGTNEPKPLEEISLESWDRVFELNVTSNLLLAQAIAPGMKRNRWGRIILLSSIMGLASHPGRACYSATKSAVLGICRALALELGPFGITVNAIAPGPILTDLPSSLLTAEQQKVVASRTALGRWGQPEELAGPALLLASDAGAFITGSVLQVDGGIPCRTFD